MMPIFAMLLGPVILGLLLLIGANILAFWLIPKVQHQVARTVLTVAVIALDVWVLLKVSGLWDALWSARV